MAWVLDLGGRLLAHGGRALQLLSRWVVLPVLRRARAAVLVCRTSYAPEHFGVSSV